MSSHHRKPFTCTFKGCDMDFVSEDHLNWHRKKHNVDLNLSIENKNNEISDQTPTPTRFIRNCEEVGLFQDLQHVNPFEETFKKAIQSKEGHSLSVPETTGDDTLHTPHVFPPMDEIASQKYSNLNHGADKDSMDDILIIDNPSDSVDCIDLTTDDESEQQPPLNTDHSSQQPEVTRIRVRQFLTEKSRKTTVDNVKTTKTIQTPANTDSFTVKWVVNDVERQKIREMNRAAQKRCRTNKKMKQKRMEIMIRCLQVENEKLKSQNISLRHELEDLKLSLVKDITRNKKNPQNNDKTNKNKEVTQEKTISSSSSTTLSKRLRPIRPAPLWIPTTETATTMVSTQPVSKPAESIASQANTVVATSPMIVPKPSNTIIVQIPSVSGVSSIPTMVPMQNTRPILLNTQPIIITGNPGTMMSVQSPVIQNPVIQNNPVNVSNVVQLL